MLLSFCLLLHLPPLGANEILSNDDVIKMVKAKLPDDLVITKIKVSKNRFDTSTDALATLQTQGVSIGIVKTMIEASVGQTAVAKDATGDLPAGEVLVKTSDRYAPIAGVNATSNVSRAARHIPFYGRYAPHKVVVSLTGVKAPVRTSDPRPEFYSRVDPAGLRLVYLGEDGDTRYISFYDNKTDREVQVRTEVVRDGLYRVVPVNPLKEGEYAFIKTASASGAKGVDGLLLLAGAVGAGGVNVKAFDFGIDVRTDKNESAQAKPAE
jgi:hypothetical protein